MGESNLDENPAILELGIVADMYNNMDKETANKTPNVLQRVQRKCEKKKLHWGIRQGGNSDKKKETTRSETSWAGSATLGDTSWARLITNLIF